MDPAEIEALLDKYQRKETTPLENELIENWLRNPDSQGSDWNTLDVPNQDEWLGAVLNRIDATVDQRDQKVIKLHPYGKWWKGAAAAAAVLAIFFSVFLGWPAAKSFLFKDELMAVKAPPEAIREITLSDGSKVWINKGAELRYAARFSGKTREVYLTGEAYFDIKHDSRHPFIVHTGNLFTTVLGTAFNINRNDRDHQIVVTVTRGKVSVSDEKQVLGILTPNQQLTCNTVSSAHRQSPVDAPAVTAWLQNDLHFEDVTFADAAKDLEQRFRVRILFSNDKSRNCRFTGTLLKGKDLEQILKVICAFNNATYQKQAHGNIMIYGNGCE